MITRETVHSWRVLVVDDEPDSLEVVMRVLRFYGALVFTASNGEEGLKAARDKAPTFILSDLSMPKVDGWEMRFQLEADPHTRDIPVVALTAHAMGGDRERAISAGFQYYLTKPLSPITLLDDLLKLFNTDTSAPVMAAPESLPQVSLGGDLLRSGGELSA